MLKGNGHKWPQGEGRKNVRKRTPRVRKIQPDGLVHMQHDNGTAHRTSPRAARAHDGAGLHAYNTKSSDRNHMRGWPVARHASIQREQRCEILNPTYLSSRPSVAPTCPTPVSSWYWRNESEPVSQGIRSARSARCKARDQILIVMIGRLDPRDDSRVGASPCLTVADGSDDRIEGLADVDDRAGRDVAAYSPSVMKRIAINAKYPYCRIRQKMFDIHNGITELWAAFSASDSSFVDSSPSFSNRLRVSFTISSPVIFGASRVLTVSAVFVIPSQMNQP